LLGADEEEQPGVGVGRSVEASEQETVPEGRPGVRGEMPGGRRTASQSTRY